MMQGRAARVARMIVRKGNPDVDPGPAIGRTTELELPSVRVDSTPHVPEPATWRQG
jgi:hypothetical protein